MSALEWISPGGLTTDLNSFVSGFLLREYPKGLGMPPTAMASEPVYNAPGQLLEAVRLEVRDVTIPLGVLGETRQDIDVLIAYLSREMDPTSGFGALRVEREDGSARLLICRYSAGLEGELLVGEAPGGDLWIEPDLELRAFDPLLIDEADTTRTWATAGGADWFGHPWFPLTLGGSTVFGDTTVSNIGDALAWPVFTIRGPGNDPVLTNETTGAFIDLSAGGGISLLAGDTLVVDTRPEIGTIVKTVGGVVTNAWGAMTASSDLWPLVRGDNVLHLAFGGADSNTEVELAFRLRWLTA